MEMSKDAIVVLFISLVMSLLVFFVMAMQSDKLNARIRTLEIQAGLGDKWAQ